jgi:hypothetical protein
MEAWMRETLIILPTDDAVHAAEVLALVRQRFGNRVLVVAEADAPRVATIHGSVIVAPGEVVADVPTGLTETEQFGIAAWNARGEIEKKVRPGDGHSWDATGFEAP